MDTGRQGGFQGNVPMARNGIYPPSIKPGIPKLGKCPNGWKTVRFGEILSVSERKVDVDDTREYQLVIAKRNRGGIEPRARLRGKEILTKTQQLICHGDFLISRRQIIHGACGLVPPGLDGALVSNEYSALLPKGGGLLPEYLAHFSHSIHFQKTCFHSSVGVDVEKMVFRLPDWLHHKFHLPPLTEQVQITNVLSAWDRGIDQLERLIAAKERRKRGLRQQLLTGKRRFSEFEASPTIRHEFGSLVSPVKDKHDPRTAKESLPCIELEHISKDTGTLLGCTDSQRQRSLKTIFRSGDVLFGKLRPYLRKYALVDMQGVCSTEIWVLRPRTTECTNKFLFATVQSGNFLRAACVSSGSKMPRSNWDLVSEVVVRLPCVEEQLKIASVLDCCNRAIDQLRTQLNALKHQKKGLMQKLLTGEVRVKIGKKEQG